MGKFLSFFDQKINPRIIQPVERHELALSSKKGNFKSFFDKELAALKSEQLELLELFDNATAQLQKQCESIDTEQICSQIRQNMSRFITFKNSQIEELEKLLNNKECNIQWILPAIFREFQLKVVLKTAFQINLSNEPFYILDKIEWYFFCRELFQCEQFESICVCNYLVQQINDEKIDSNYIDLLTYSIKQCHNHRTWAIDSNSLLNKKISSYLIEKLTHSADKEILINLILAIEKMQLDKNQKVELRNIFERRFVPMWSGEMDNLNSNYSKWDLEKCYENKRKLKFYFCTQWYWTNVLNSTSVKDPTSAVFDASHRSTDLKLSTDLLSARSDREYLYLFPHL